MAEQYVEKRSGNRDSGNFANWSNWYELCSDPLPDGAKITRYAFHLEGDRQCGAWAECRPKKITDDQICWEFRMQGHNEGGIFHIGNPNEGIKQSEGVLQLWYTI